MLGSLTDGMAVMVQLSEGSVKLQMRMLLLERDLLRIVKGTKSEPTTGQDEIRKPESMMIKLSSLKCIIINLSENVVLHVSNVKTSRGFRSTGR